MKSVFAVAAATRNEIKFSNWFSVSKLRASEEEQVDMGSYYQFGFSCFLCWAKMSI